MADLSKDFRIPQLNVPILYCDNVSALHLTVYLFFRARTKHGKTDYHYVREQFAVHKLETQHVSTSDQLGDIFRKPLLLHPFQHILYKPASP